MNAVKQLTIIAMQMCGKPFERRLADLYIISTESQRRALESGFSACFDFWAGFVKDAIDVEATEHPPVEHPPVENIS